MSHKAKPRLGVCVSAALFGLGSWSIVVACSSEDSARPTFDGGDASETSTPTSGFDATYPEEDAGACPPKAPAKPLRFSPTTRFQPGSCTAAQVDGYVKDCLESDGNTCTTYKTANTTCAKCIESADIAPEWGAIVFYGVREYYDYNYGGCIANVLNDFSETGCGAAETRYLECRHAACAHCLPAGLPRDFAPFYECQTKNATDKLCATELADVSKACGAYFAGKPTDACQGAGIATPLYLRQLVTAWCGGTAVDAGTDGGDGGDGG